MSEPDAKPPAPQHFVKELSASLSFMGTLGSRLTRARKWVIDNPLLFGGAMFLVVASPIVAWALSLWPALSGANIMISIALNVLASLAAAYGLSRRKQPRSVLR